MLEGKELTPNELAGKSGKLEIKFKIEFTWDGVIQKGGYTILEIEYDVQNDSMIKSEITQTNAVINLEDPDFWFDLGRSIGPLLAPQPGVY